MAHATGQDVQTFRKNMQMVFQNPYSSLNPKMNVLQNITFGLTANQVPRDEACPAGIPLPGRGWDAEVLPQ